jgi:ABC-2 type transport system permease protein
MRAKVWWACVRLGALHRFAYRMEVLSAVVSAAVVVFLNASVWNAVVDGRPGLAGLSPVEVSTYAVIAWIATIVSATRLDEILGARVRDGQIATDLIKPLDLHLWLILRDLGRAGASAALTAAPVLVLAASVFPFVWPSRVGSWLWVALSMVLATLIGGQLAFLIGLVAFRLKNVSGLAHFKASATAVLSGAVVPVQAMPDALRDVVVWLPFQGMSHTPAMLFLEQLDGAGVTRALGVQAAWVVGLFLACRWSWARAIDHLTVQGG